MSISVGHVGLLEVDRNNNITEVKLLPHLKQHTYLLRNQRGHTRFYSPNRGPDTAARRESNPPSPSQPIPVDDRRRVHAPQSDPIQPN